MTKHPCHAERCNVEVPPARLMCGRHWFLVPVRLRRAVWREYVPGQEVTKTPTAAYLEAARAAIAAVAAIEAGRTPPQVEPTSPAGNRWRQGSIFDVGAAS